MGGILLLAFLASATASTRGERMDARCRNDRRISATGLCGEDDAGTPAPAGPLFAFATPAGTGMTAQCACTAITGTKGEVMTFTRASVAYCTKGNITANIANGDVVECAANQPRVMAGGNGDGGVGLDMWADVTNTALRSQEFDNSAVWIGFSSGVAAPTITANAAVAPDGTTTAERIQVPATAIGQYSSIYQSGMFVGTNSKGVYVRGVSGSGTLQVSIDVNNIVNCPYVSTSWSRCILENKTGSQYFHIGNQTPLVAMNAVDAYIWQADNHAASTALGPPIKTAGTATTRAIESASFAIPSGGAGKFSTSLAVEMAASTPNGGVVAQWQGASEIDNYTRININGTNNMVCNLRIAATNSAMTTATTTIPSANNTFSCSYDLTTQAECLNGACSTTPTAVTLPTFTTFAIGGLPTSLTINGVVKKVCLDTTPTGCP